MGVWISVVLSIVNRMELVADKCRDSIFLQYGIEPSYLPPIMTSAVSGYQFRMHPTARRADLSRIIIMSYVTGSRTCTARPSLPHICMTNP